VNQTQSQQAGSTLLCFCQKIASSNGIHIRSVFCKSGELYKNWLLKESEVDFNEEPPEYLDYDQAVQAYELYNGTKNFNFFPVYRKKHYNLIITFDSKFY